MPNRILLTVFLFFTVIDSGFSQQHKSVTVIPLPNEHRRQVVDSAPPSSTYQGGKLLASNDLGKTLLAVSPDSGQGYTHVPLAGESSYYGEKTDYVNDFVRRYMELHNQTLSSVKNNSATPFTIMDNALEERKMPKELKYLAVIESALNHKAVSRAGAVGPWQLMEATARMMGLTVNRKNDERTDWNKSTDAALRYLDLLYGQLNDWLLVIAAYNCGPNAVQRALDKTGSHTFWEIKDYLPQETQGHVLAFIATASIFENLSKFINLGSVPLDFSFSKVKAEEFEPKDEPLKAGVVSDTRKVAASEEEEKNLLVVSISTPLNPDFIATAVGIDKRTLLKFNPDYENFILRKYPSNTFKLHLPKDKIAPFLAKKEELEKRSKEYYKENQL